ncbi:hypothetical protein [Shinella sp. JR1-6]|uniref:hypothetical protein n=1 Tax=Shinella sp. JR1-6 TaxID=2527671 RepID=UPI00102D398C|nr:hypothetical protein [Shinella sp. JR1-6]TAA54812.1 hypothetical protein EXZ48_25930 [Shinella sp. JR1-6]
MAETVNRHYPVPDPSQPQRADAVRIAAAITAIDADVAELLLTLGSKANSADIGPAISDAIDALIAGAPAALDTLAEIAAKLAYNDDVVAALVGTIAGKTSQADHDLLVAAVADLTGVVATKANAGNVYSRAYLDAAFIEAERRALNRMRQLAG